ncbi:hypothetical protein NADFUDRAFT_42479 [Nadsonia fulvescens var. elongata DSM 6958]|uniref:rRNA-processing protein n=1 Tax=Nadsonia fulvescens var. elongata DSM 6958 TaxID=857566 RepID=A0A1E3PIF1_9ASCO|nr:hypothetical protein NADFUDRAFT_42479 [Nadsonia fulvescens var. elongata DSM 6958]
MSGDKVQVANTTVVDSHGDDEKVGVRVSGKQWKSKKAPLRIHAVGVPSKSWDKKYEARMAEKATKDKIAEMKAEKEAERKSRVQAIKDKKAAREEKERFEKMALVMNAKKIARVKRKEKRNKLLKER